MLRLSSFDPNPMDAAQIVTAGGGIFTPALSISPFEPITPNRKRVAVLRAAQQLPPEGNSSDEERLYREALQANGSCVPAIINLAASRIREGELGRSGQAFQQGASGAKGIPSGGGPLTPNPDRSKEVNGKKS